MKARILRPGALLAACALMLMSLCLPRTGAQETLPRAAADAVRALFPDGAVTGVEVETDEGITLYVVRVERGRLTTDVEVSAEGLVGEVETELGLDDVPGRVAAAIRETLKGGELVALEQHEQRGRVEGGRVVPLTVPLVVYEVKFVLDGRNRIVEIADTPALKLPPAARAAVQKAFPAARVTDVSSEREGGLLLYDVRLEQDGLRIELDVSAEGVIASVETAAEAGTLPRAVAKAMARAAPDAEVVGIGREEIRAVPRLVELKRPRVVYEVAFMRDGKRHEISIAPDGTIVETEEDDVEAAGP